MPKLARCRFSGLDFLEHYEKSRGIPSWAKRLRSLNLPLWKSYIVRMPIAESAWCRLGSAGRVDRGGLVVHRSHALAIEHPTALDALHFLATPADARVGSERAN